MEIVTGTALANAGKYAGNYCFVTIFHYKNSYGEEVELDLGCPPLGTLLCDILNNDFDNIFSPLIREIEQYEKESNSNTDEFIKEQMEIHNFVKHELMKQNTESLHDIIDNVFLSDSNSCSSCSISEKLYYYAYFFDEIEFRAKIRLNGFRNDDLQLPEPFFATNPSKHDLLISYKEAYMKKYDPKRPSTNEFEYELYSCKDLVKCILLEMSKHNIIVKRCANCGKYFIPLNRSDTIYCDNPAPQDKSKTCKKYGAEKQYQKNLKNNEAMGLYRKIYMSKQMLVKRHSKEKDPLLHDLYSKAFEMFKSQSAQWKADVKLNRKTDEEYLGWLKTVKKKKVL